VTAEPPVVELRGARKKRQDGDRSFELDVPHLAVGIGERIALTGRSGSGKSTLIEILAAALAPDEIEVFTVYHPGARTSSDVGAAWRRRDDAFITALRARCFGYVQQVGGLLGFLSVRQNIALSLDILGTPENGQIDALAEALGIAALLDAYPNDLSVGQRQRVAIARALVHEPALVLADEPTAALDIGTAATVMGEMTTAAEQRGITLVLATHDERLARDFGFRLVRAETDIQDRRQWTRFAYVAT